MTHALPARILLFVAFACFLTVNPPLDNLLKGAVSHVIQNVNLALEIDEYLGLGVGEFSKRP